MAKFLDGPAKGVSLLLKRAPILLRAVESPGGGFNWDALDQLDDEAAPEETIVVYRIVGMPAPVHICRSPRSQSGWYQIADYRVLAEQPDDKHVRTTRAWHEWCEANQERLKQLFAAEDAELGQ